MDRLWAPWRVKYITKILKKQRGCVFCKIVKQKKDAQNYVFIRTKHCFSVLNIYPYNNGHCLVLPNRHVDSLKKMTREEKTDMFQLLEKTTDLLDEVLKPEGYNVGINFGRVAGAGFPDHVHIHIVPRWRGDVNFMPVTANTRVVSQSLGSIYKKLNHANKKRH